MIDDFLKWKAERPAFSDDDEFFDGYKHNFKDYMKSILKDLLEIRKELDGLSGDPRNYCEEGHCKMAFSELVESIKNLKMEAEDE